MFKYKFNFQNLNFLNLKKNNIFKLVLIFVITYIYINEMFWNHYNQVYVILYLFNLFLFIIKLNIYIYELFFLSFSFYLYNITTNIIINFFMYINFIFYSYRIFLIVLINYVNLLYESVYITFILSSVYQFYFYDIINSISEPIIYFSKKLIFFSSNLIILNIIVIILFILIGGVIPLLERKYLSLIQRRIGPKFVGFNGRLQFIADAIKLLLKELIFLTNTNKFILIFLPIFLLNINLFILINIVWLQNIKIIDNNFFFLQLLIIELLTTFFLTYIGFNVKNKYTIIASVRLINGSIVFEIFLSTIYLYIYIYFNQFNFNYTSSNFNINKVTLNILIIPYIFHFILIMLKKVPFDIIEAETELIMGYSSEHSGFLSGSLLLIEYLHLYFFSYLLLYIFIF